MVRIRAAIDRARQLAAKQLDPLLQPEDGSSPYLSVTAAQFEEALTEIEDKVKTLETELYQEVYGELNKYFDSEVAAAKQLLHGRLIPQHEYSTTVNGLRDAQTHLKNYFVNELEIELE